MNYSIPTKAMSREVANTYLDRNQRSRDVHNYFDPCNWMGKMPLSFFTKKINEVILPGSWQAGAYDFSPNALGTSNLAILVSQFPSLLPWIKRYYQHHSKTITQQLRSGVRYLDLKIGYHHGDDNLLLTTSGYYLTSGFNCIPLSDVLIQVSTFCYTNPTEIVLIEITTDDSVTNIKELLGIISGSWKYFLHPNSSNNIFYANLGEMLTVSQRIVLFADRIANDYKHLVWPSYLINHCQDEISSGEEKQAALVKHLESIKYNETKICHLSWVVHPTFLNFTTNLLICRQNSYRDAAEVFNRGFTSFLLQYQQLILSKARIISFAWWENDTLIREVAQLNYKLLPTSYNLTLQT